MNRSGIASPEGQGVTFVELFFDLVFVFAITQITRYAAGHLDGLGIVRSALVFWLVWWGWTQFTWALNAANTQHQGVRLATLIATAVAAVMAVSIDGAFSPDSSRALLFATSCIGIRLFGLALFLRVVFHDREQRSAVAFYFSLAVFGLLAVLAGALVDPALRLGLWVLAVALDLAAGLFSGNRRPAHIQTGHFAERHGLIVIIALGESLVVAAGGFAHNLEPAVAATGVLAVVITCLLWWTYFGWVKDVLEERMSAIGPFDRALLGRDAYTFGHLPLVGGIIALAIGFEVALRADRFSTVQTAATIGVGLSLFLVSTAAARWRAKGCVLWNRLIILTLTVGALVVSARASVQQILAVAAIGLAAIVIVEQVTIRRRLVLGYEARSDQGVRDTRDQDPD